MKNLLNPKCLLAASAAFSLVLAASAAQSTHNWFDTGIGGYQDDHGESLWPTDGSDYEVLPDLGGQGGGIWTSTASATYDTESTCLRIAEGESLKFTANETVALSNVYATVVSELVMTPCPADELPEIPSEAKCGVIAVESGETTNLWVLALDAGGSACWTNTEYSCDLSSPVMLTTVVSNGVDATWARYDFNSGDYSQLWKVRAAEELHGVGYVGEAELVSLCGDHDDLITEAAKWQATIDGYIDDVSAENRAAVEATLNALEAVMLGYNPEGNGPELVNDWLYDVYGGRSVPAGKLAATTGDLISLSLYYYLPIMENEPTVEIESAEATAGSTAAFTFVFKDGEDPLWVVSTTGYPLEMIRYSDEVDGEFSVAAQADPAVVGFTVDGNRMTVYLLEGGSRGFLKADFSTPDFTPDPED